MRRKYLLDCSANGAKWADDVKYKLELYFVALGTISSIKIAGKQLRAK